METIPAEIVVYILNNFELDVVNQLSFLMTCKYCYGLLSFLIVTDPIEINRHSACLKHYHYFSNVIVTKEIVTLPRMVKRATFLSPQNPNLFECLPSSVTHLTLFDKLNQPIMHLNSQLKSLVVGNSSNQSIDHLPATLSKLRLGTYFNQPIDCLPLHLTKLKLGWDFNQPVDHLPSSLQVLRLGHCFNQPIISLPPNLQSLRLGWKFNQSIDHLPATLKGLKLQFNFNQPIVSLPPNLKSLQFGNDFNQPIDHCLPNSLECLKLGSKFNQPINRSLPNSLTFLRLDCNYYAHTLDKYLPPTLKILMLENNLTSLEVDALSFSIQIWIRNCDPTPITALQVLGKKNGYTIYCRKQVNT